VVNIIVDFVYARLGQKLEDALENGLAHDWAMGLGISPVSGESRVPFPAARTITFTPLSSPVGQTRLFSPERRHP
jgi:hypothetical protein